MSLLVPLTAGLVGIPQCLRVRHFTSLSKNLIMYKIILQLIAFSGHPREGGREADVINSI